MKAFARYHLLRILRKHPISDQDWRRYSSPLPLLEPFDAAEKAHLRILSTLFLHQKQFTGAQGMQITREVEITIAAQACVEILNLGIDAYAGWVEIIVYPDAFVVEREQTDENGVVSQQNSVLSGESWGQGPVIFSWQDVARDSFKLRPGHNVVIHEFAHKLDMLNGRANGMPPLHPGMPIDKWTQALSQAYTHLLRRLEQGHRGQINPYAATNPAEFFAVMCEYFFTAPHLLHDLEPGVYAQLCAYFQRDPLHPE